MNGNLIKKIWVGIAICIIPFFATVGNLEAAAQPAPSRSVASLKTLEELEELIDEIVANFRLSNRNSEQAGNAESAINDIWRKIPDGLHVNIKDNTDITDKIKEYAHYHKKFMDVEKTFAVYIENNIPSEKNITTAAEIDRKKNDANTSIDNAATTNPILLTETQLDSRVTEIKTQIGKVLTCLAAINRKAGEIQRAKRQAGNEKTIYPQLIKAAKEKDFDNLDSRLQEKIIAHIQEKEKEINNSNLSKDQTVINAVRKAVEENAINGIRSQLELSYDPNKIKTFKEQAAGARNMLRVLGHVGNNIGDFRKKIRDNINNTQKRNELINAAKTPTNTDAFSAAFAAIYDNVIQGSDEFDRTNTLIDNAKTTALNTLKSNNNYYNKMLEPLIEYSKLRALRDVQWVAIEELKNSDIKKEKKHNLIKSCTDLLGETIKKTNEKLPTDFYLRDAIGNDVAGGREQIYEIINAALLPSDYIGAAPKEATNFTIRNCSLVPEFKNSPPCFPNILKNLSDALAGIQSVKKPLNDAEFTGFLKTANETMKKGVNGAELPKFFIHDRWNETAPKAAEIAQAIIQKIEKDYSDKIKPATDLQSKIDLLLLDIINKIAQQVMEHDCYKSLCNLGGDTMNIAFFQEACKLIKIGIDN
ncbi:MAG: hypothetical protein LBS71_01905, partial [Puniceicoccales bacterium]|nr:hypothetical protein [Puniceicoccales bacterium]